jgi:hypothetical protein
MCSPGANHRKAPRGCFVIRLSVARNGEDESLLRPSVGQFNAAAGFRPGCFTRSPLLP